MNTLLALPDRIAERHGDVLALLGRLCIGALFLPDAYGKIMNFSAFAASLGPKGLPFPTLWAILAIIAVGGGAIGAILGYRTRLAAVLLIAFCIMANATSHQFWALEGPQRMAQYSAFIKNTALIGGLIFLWIYGAGRLSLDGRARNG